MTNPLKSPEEDTKSEGSEDDTVQGYIRRLVGTEGVFGSPIDINIAQTKIIETPPLEWHNFETLPRKMKITNSGHTVIVSAKWKDERPYIEGGPLSDKYVFSQMHFHWGANDMEGSEHSTDGMKSPAELHVVLFKCCYLTQEAALKEEDGIVILVYFIRLRGGEDETFQKIMDALPNVQYANTSMKIAPFALEDILKPFSDDFFCYWGSVVTSECAHFVLWLIGRVPIGVTQDQLEQIRIMFNANEDLLKQNFRELQPAGERSVFHINPSGSKYATLKPFALDETKYFY